jgi:TolB-like protein/DNA-binding winged helix-turn-helix (wHTH) protein
MKTITPSTALFGPYTLDLRSGELRKHGTKVKMGEQPFQILLLLLASPGELVTREELRAKLWADDTFVDFDHGLNSAVQRLRDCFSDTAEKPLWVETIPRRGYRFIGQVDLAGGAGLSSGNGEGAALRDETVKGVEGEAAAAASLPAQGRGRGMEFRGAAVWIPVVTALLLVWPLVRVVSRWKMASSEASVPIRSIAVLPLENLSGDPGQDYFADGMTDELITTLAKNRELRITSRTSVMRYKGATRSIREIAGELGVDGVVAGSVARSGNRVRVNAQLIRASNDSHIWSESYDRNLGDVLSLQEELARAIAEHVRVTSLPSIAASAGAAALSSPEAYDAYLRGQYYWFRGEFQRSREFFQKSIDLDPGYARAYAGLANSYMGLGGESMPKGEAAAHKSLEIDDSLAEGHLSLAAVKLFFRWDWSGAESEARRAIQLDPSLAEGHHIYSYALSILNRVPEALEQEKISQQLDPLDRPWGLGRAFLRQRRFDEAIQEFRSQIEVNPDIDSLHEMLGEAYYRKGLLSEAFAEREKAMALDNDFEGADRIWKTRGSKAVMEWNLDRLKKRVATENISCVNLAELSAVAGHQDEAIHYLQEALEQHDADLVWLKQNPKYDSLHSDPRFQAIVKSVGLP